MLSVLDLNPKLNFGFECLAKGSANMSILDFPFEISSRYIYYGESDLSIKDYLMQGVLALHLT